MDCAMRGFSVLLSLLFLYFLQGLPYGIQIYFLPIVLRTKGVSLSKIGLMKLLFLPWAMKVLWAPFIEKGRDERKYLIIALLSMSLLCYVLSITNVSNVYTTVFFLAVLNLLTSVQDIIVDGLAVALLSKENVGWGNTAQLLGYKLGGVIGGSMFLTLHEEYGGGSVFFWFSFLYVGSAIICFPLLGQHNLKNYPPQPYSQGGQHHKIEDNLQEPQVVDEQRLTGKMESGGRLTDRGNRGGGLPTTGCRSTATAGDACAEDVDEPTLLNSSDKNSLKEGFSADQSVMHTWKTAVTSSGTQWMLLYLVVYKLGEKGLTGVQPLFLLDHAVPASTVSFYTGTIGSWCSVVGSLVAGLLLATPSCTIYRMSVILNVTTAILCAMMSVVSFSTYDEVNTAQTAITIFISCFLTLAAGVNSTIIFSWMMLLSQNAPTHV